MFFSSSFRYFRWFSLTIITLPCCNFNSLISNCILQLAETYGMEFFETSASTSSNISEVGHRNDHDNCRTLPSAVSLIIHVFILHPLSPSVLHSSDRTGTAGSQERRRPLVGISGWLPGEGLFGGREGQSGHWEHSEHLHLLERLHATQDICSTILLETVICWPGRLHFM